MSLEKTIEAIKKHERFLIMSHIGLEGDSIGCQLAFAALLKNMGKRYTIINGGELPGQYDFMGVKDKISTDLGGEADYDAAVVLDCPVVRRVGPAKKYLKKGKTILNIDHHISNDYYGTINWVQGGMSSCGEMVYMLYEKMGAPLDREAALYLYVAILTDTGSFAYESTTSRTHAVVSELLSKGVDPMRVHQALYENRSLKDIELLRDALSTLRLVKDGDIAYMYVSEKMLKKHGLGHDATEDFINYARSIGGTRIAIIFIKRRGRKNTVRVSFRSKGEVNVGRLAALFGGGGHKNASGCLVEGSLRSVIRDVLGKVTENV